MFEKLDMQHDFARRHIGPSQKDIQPMLEEIGIKSVDELIKETIPANILLKNDLNLPEAVSEFGMLTELRNVAKKNRVFKSLIGLGYYNCITPSVILRNIFENPGWYTQYTPYQAEISQGRLEALLNFQTMVSDLTGLEISTASLLDEATAAAEAMSMLHRVRPRELVKQNANRFFVSETLFPQTIDVLKTRAQPQGIEIVVGDHQTFDPDEQVFGVIVQYPATDGKIYDYTEFIRKMQEKGIRVIMATDLMALLLLTSPAELGVDVVVGSAQRFGVPLGYGGPHAAFFATRDEFKRHVPGRIIGVSVDKHGNNAYRMALQTREQHIRREKATSNICTAQALLAIMAGMYAVYHGPDRLKSIALRIHGMTRILDEQLSRLGLRQTNEIYFDTLAFKLSGPWAGKMEQIRAAALEAGFNFNYTGDETFGIALDETIQEDDLQQLADIFAGLAGKESAGIDVNSALENMQLNYPEKLNRTSAFLTHPIFNSFHSETEMMRYVKRLENRDLSLTTSMIPLGSCTMKLNAATEMLPVTWPEYASMHPFAPVEQAQGYSQIFTELEKELCEITGLAAASLQPNSGAQGEFSSLMTIRAYYRDRNEGHRTVCLIPSSAHGTNPASAVMAGMDVVIVKCDEAGNIEVSDLREKAEQNRERLAAIMVTYPSTHGVYEEQIREICSIVHENGGQVFMDGANMNAQVGLTSPAAIGADICHLNLHKTFAIPHGGGGPGMGPICAAKHLAPFLPGHPLVKVGGEKAITAVSAAPWGSANILLISHAYIRMLGKNGLKKASQMAILNANYIKARLEKEYPVLYKGQRGRVAHELIFDLRHFKQSAGIEVEDVAKRLMDYNFHAPTVSFPVAGTLMVEPTESESKEELDRFCDAMIAIREEIREIEEGKADREDNLLKNAPHTAEEVVSAEWKHPYSRERAVYPLHYLRAGKFWPVVGRIDNSYGDRNLMCSCPPIESYQKADFLTTD